MSHGIVFSWLPVSSRPWQNSECWKNFLMNLDGLAIRDTCRIMSHQHGTGHSFSRRWCWQADKDTEKLVRNPSKAAHGDATGPQNSICDVSSIVSGTVSISWSSVVQDVRNLLFHSCLIFANRYFNIVSLCPLRELSMQEESKTLQNAAKLLPLDSGNMWSSGLEVWSCLQQSVCAVSASAFVFQHVMWGVIIEEYK